MSRFAPLQRKAAATSTATPAHAPAEAAHAPPAAEAPRGFGELERAARAGHRLADVPVSRPGAGSIREAADLGTSGPGGSLPHLAQIQRSFGKHDVTGLRAHTGGEATAGSLAMGAEAFTKGSHIAFAGQPSLHTAAHEAAHAIQQRAGISVPGGVGQVGDRHERHADAVADRVAAGRSSEDLLNQYESRTGAGEAPVQRLIVGRDGTTDVWAREIAQRVFDLGGGQLARKINLLHSSNTRIQVRSYDDLVNRINRGEFNQQIFQSHAQSPLEEKYEAPPPRQRANTALMSAGITSSLPRALRNPRPRPSQARNVNAINQPNAPPSLRRMGTPMPLRTPRFGPGDKVMLRTGQIVTIKALVKDNANDDKVVYKYTRQGKGRPITTSLTGAEISFGIPKHQESVPPQISAPRKNPPVAADNRTLAKFAKRTNKLNEIVWADHRGAISAVCKRHHYIICIRETGPLSIKRIGQGAKAKPHTILEKSIKDSSLAKAYGDKNAETMRRRMEQLDLDGFVGHWGGDGLKGVRIDGANKGILENVPTARGPKGELYVPVDPNAEGGGPALQALKAQPEWQSHLYTGDYDMHEAYEAGGGMIGQIPEASKQKVKLINRLNLGIQKGAGKTKADPKRWGKAYLHGGGHGSHPTVHTKGPHAMFQHGDQATYIMNQHLEHEQAKAKAKANVVKAEKAKENATDHDEKYDEQYEQAKKVESDINAQKAQLVPAVASESDEPIAWCVFGKWYVTLNVREHAEFRLAHGLAAPHAWREQEQAALKSGQWLSAQHKK